jgi:beta-galactosidase
LELTNAGGRGIRVRSRGLLGVTVWPYTAEDLENAAHGFELPRREFLTVCVDGFQVGVGGDNSWGLPVMEKYRLRGKESYGFGFTVSAI